MLDPSRKHGHSDRRWPAWSLRSTPSDRNGATASASVNGAHPPSDDQAGRAAVADRLRRPARRWRAQLHVVYAHGYQVAAEAISSPGEVPHGGELVQETVAALKAERAGGGSGVPATKDPVVVLAYGLGAWPAGAD